MTVNPWDCPPILDRGDRIKNTTYRSVGQALSNWEFYEFSLGLIFRSIISADWDGPLEQAYGSIITHTGRVQMIQAAAKVYFRRHPTGPQKDLSDMLRKAEKWCKRRNEIAHGRVNRFEERPGWFLLPSYFAVNKHEIIGVSEGVPNQFGMGRAKAQRRPTYAYTSEQIKRVADGFWDLAQEAGAIAPMFIHDRITARIMKMSESHPELLQQWLQQTSKPHRSSVRSSSPRGRSRPE